MAIFNYFKKMFYTKEELEIIDESLKQFKNKKKKSKVQGEGYEDIHNIQGFGNVGTGSFNLFYEKNINKDLKNNKTKLIEYRKMYDMPEIASVIEDAAMEASQQDLDGNVIKLELVDDIINKNENIKKNIQEEFDKLFKEKIEISKYIEDWLISLFVDGKIYIENIINKSRPSLGILGVKKLPCETMDYDIDASTGKITNFFQFLVENAKKPTTPEEAENSDKVITFYPSQITFVDSGIYGINKKDVLGYLHKCKQPFNQLRLLETSVVIYRLIRSPERLVFKIDTGNMPKDKSMKYVEQIKNKFTKKQVYDPNTGNLTNNTDVTSILENFFMAQSSDGRGSDITSIGGNPSGFAELDDIHYFQKKLYMALKYPMSRVISMHENRNGEIILGGNQDEIARDEIKWAKFLEKYQNRLCSKLLDLFLLHLTFIGFTKQYDLDISKFRITMTPPNNYIDKINQSKLQTKFDNYQSLSNNEEFPKSFLMKKYLDFEDEDLKELNKGWEEDKKYGLKKESDF
jgi:hypothetical protein